MNSRRDASRRIFILALIVSLLGLAIVLFCYSYKICLAEGISMEPTLYPGQIFVLDKKAYEHGRLPQPGDLIVFDDRMYGAKVLKRVIGLPGDRIQLKGHDIIINQNPIPRETLTSRDETHLEFLQTLPGGASFHIFENKDPSAATDPFEGNAFYQVPGGRYFVAGDNRDNAHDSRNGRGPIPLEDIVGRVVLVVPGKVK